MIMPIKLDSCWIRVQMVNPLINLPISSVIWRIIMLKPIGSNLLGVINHAA